MVIRKKRGVKTKRRRRAPGRPNKTFPTLSQIDFIQSASAKYGLLVGLLVNLIFLLAWLLYQCIAHK